MTPLPASLKSSWQMAALSREVTDRPLARTVVGVPLVLFRTDAGVLDIAPRRFDRAPVQIDHVQSCHGGRFQHDGAQRG